MKKIQKHIAIVRSGITQLSSLSLVSANAILELLETYYEKVEIIEVNTLKDLPIVKEANPDLVFLGMKFVPSDPKLGLDDPNKVWLTDFLDKNDILYTGSGQVAHELELNKDLAKQLIKSKGINTSNFYVRRRLQTIIPLSKLIYPLFIKPTNRGGGLGIDNSSLVTNSLELEAKILSIDLDFGSDALIEEYLPGREFSVAIIKHDTLESYSAMPLELVAPLNDVGARILSGEVKISDTETFMEVTDLRLKNIISELALKVFSVIGASDYGRIDIRLDVLGIPHFLEANLLPSLLKDYGNFPKACFLNSGLGYEDMILKITRLGFEKSQYIEPLINVPIVSVL